MKDKPIAAGKSSFGLIDFGKLLEVLDVVPGITFLDVACGAGAYTLALADVIGPDGKIYALDLWEEGIAALERDVRQGQGATIEARVADVSRHMPIEDAAVDLCLMATVLHDLIEDSTDEGALQEVVRVLKPGGKLAVVEFKKMEGPPGPPIAIRLSPEDTEARLRPHAFKLMTTRGLGPFNYVSMYRLSKDAGGCCGSSVHP